MDKPTVDWACLARPRTFQLRRGRMSGRHHTALARWWPSYGVAVPGPPVCPATWFGQAAPLVLEIGSGMGEATVEMAAADPTRNYLAVEVHPPGVANLLALAGELGLRNLRVAYGDALDLLRGQLPPASLAAVHVFFPDPWPKTRHRNRRLFQSERVALMRSRLARGGMLHAATDWPDYAELMRQVLTADPELINAYPGFAPRPAHRPVTKFEQRAIDAGRSVFDLVFYRR